mmetsp:Transcript_19771/g.27809  ORF Transcript_19771/g.27809 Transcript_19771/m.27809 type:complete len:150 (-) Transcript_19771:299-748(-)
MKASAKDLHLQNLKTFAQRKQQLRDKVTKVYSIVWGNFSHTLQSEVQRCKDFEEKDKNNDALWLLQQLKLLIAGLNKKRNIVYNVCTALKAIYTLRQQQDKMLDKYHWRFKSTVNTAELAETNPFEHKCITDMVRMKTGKTADVFDIDV